MVGGVLGFKCIVLPTAKRLAYAMVHLQFGLCLKMNLFTTSIKLYQNCISNSVGAIISILMI